MAWMGKKAVQPFPFMASEKDMEKELRKELRKRERKGREGECSGLNKNGPHIFIFECLVIRQ